MEIGAVTVRPGVRVSGRYKRANRDAKLVEIEVDRTLVVPDRYGNQTPYLVGTRLDGTAVGMVMALRADCFFPDVEAEEIGGYEAPDLSGYFVNMNVDPMFGFYEHIRDSETRAIALARGAKPAEDFEVDSLEMPAVVAE